MTVVAFLYTQNYFDIHVALLLYPVCLVGCMMLAQITQVKHPVQVEISAEVQISEEVHLVLIVPHC
jgi:hypothetical protein